MKNPPVNSLTYCTVLAHATHKALDDLCAGDATKKQVVFMMFLQAFAGYESQNDSLADTLDVVSNVLRKVKRGEVAEHLPQLKLEL